MYSSVCIDREFSSHEGIKSMERRGGGRRRREQDECININGGMKRGYRRLINPSIQTRVKFKWNFEASSKREEINNKKNSIRWGKFNS